MSSVIQTCNGLAATQNNGNENVFRDKKVDRLTVVINGLVPYHDARFTAAARLIDVHVLTLCDSSFGAGWWVGGAAHRAFSHEVLGIADRRAQPTGARGAARRRLERALEESECTAVAVQGWSTWGALTALSWATRRQIPVVLFSESTTVDRARRWWLEWVKKRLVARAGCCFVGGRSHAAYLIQLGCRPEQIVFGYDVVDNNHFMRPSRIYKLACDSIRKKLLDGPYFLSVARLSDEKNLDALIRAYAHYREFAQELWPLVIVGEGPLRSMLTALVRSLHLTEHVFLIGFRQYEDLPDIYSRAACFILPSTSEPWGLVVNEAMASGLPVLVSERCGCAAELVHDGLNGYTFDPQSTVQLAEILVQFTREGETLRRMGAKSLEIIKDWGPQRFAEGLRKAMEIAATIPAAKQSKLDQFLLWALTRR